MMWLVPETEDMAAPSVIAEGIVATTPIATENGWCAAGRLTQGTYVLTFDDGPQELLSIHSQPMRVTSQQHLPLFVPAWALDNREDLVLLPEQKVLIEADKAEELYGDPFAFIPAAALEGLRGITRFRPRQLMDAVVLGFATAQIVYASRGVMLSCPGDPFSDADWYAPEYVAYTLSQARHLVACMMAEEAGAALREIGQHHQYQMGA